MDLEDIKHIIVTNNIKTQVIIFLTVYVIYDIQKCYQNIIMARLCKTHGTTRNEKNN